MRSELMCPACGQPLSIAEDVQGVELSCPRCLAKLPVQSAIAPLSGRDIRAQQLLDTEVRRDTRRTGVGLILLAVLGALGLGYYLLLSGAAAAEGEVRPLLIFLVILAFLALLSTGIVLWRTRENPAARGVARVLFGTLALAGGLIAGCFVLCLTLVVFLFAVCLSKPLFR